MPKSEEKRPRGRPRGSKIDPFRAHVGVLTDAEVAAMAGVSISAVKLYRDRNKIAPAMPQGSTKRARERQTSPPSPRAPAPEPRKGPGRKSRIAPLHHLVGVIADADLAKQAGVTPNAVQMYRKKYGIPASGLRAGSGSGSSGGARRPEAPAAPAPSASRPGRRPTGKMFGWRLRVATGRGEDVRIAVAADAASACAAAAGAGEVIGLERLAVALT